MQRHGDCSAGLSYLISALRLQQRSAGNCLALPAGACRHETRPADHPLFPVEHTKAGASQSGKQIARCYQVSTTILAASQRQSNHMVAHGIRFTTHMHIPLHIRQLLQWTTGVVVVTLNQVSKRFQCVFLHNVHKIRCESIACHYTMRK